MTVHTDDLFAPLDPDNDMERVGGGNETDVYRTDDHQYVIKVKCDMGNSVPEALYWANYMRTHTDRFIACLGPRHTIPSFYMISRNSERVVTPVVIQPFLSRGILLHDIHYSSLDEHQRKHIAKELRDIVLRALIMYRQEGAMPDLYGRVAHSREERKRLNAPHMLPWRIWSFLVKRTLLRSNNLILVPDPDMRVILVDYDSVRQSTLYRKIYFAVRWFLFVRDHLLITLMEWGYPVPEG